MNSARSVIICRPSVCSVLLRGVIYTTDAFCNYFNSLLITVSIHDHPCSFFLLLLLHIVDATGGWEGFLWSFGGKTGPLMCRHPREHEGSAGHSPHECSSRMFALGQRSDPSKSPRNNNKPQKTVKLGWIWAIRDA